MKQPQSKAIVIGASAGAVDAMLLVLSKLPADFALPIIIVVHMPPDKESVLAELLRARSKIKVREAEDKEQIEAGTAYLAPPDYHLLVEQDGYLSLSSDEPVLYSRPSIDVLFETAADAYGEGLIGVILTGANSDGARGLKKIVEAGGTALVQDPNTAYATAMPEAAIKAAFSAEILNLEEIATYLQKAGAA